MTAWNSFWEQFFYWLGVIKGPMWILIIIAVLAGSWWLMMKKD